MQHPPQNTGPNKRRHSFQPLLFAPPQGSDALPKTLPPPASTHSDAPRRQADSHVRLILPHPNATGGLAGNLEWLEAQELLDELCEDQLTLSMNLACLERAAQNRPRDPSTRAALQSLDARIVELGNVRDALAVLQLCTISKSVQRAFLPNAPLADYVRGAYAWMHAVLRALDQLVAGLCTMQPDWASYRWRVEEAKNFHFDELEEAIEEDLVQLLSESGDEEAVGQLAAAFEAALAEARILEERLDQRFG
jgi:hypothetical protein